MITHFVSWPWPPGRLYRGTMESKIRGFVHFSNFICVTYCVLARALDIYGLFKMVFDCLWVVVDVFEVVVDGC